MMWWYGTSQVFVSSCAVVVHTLYTLSHYDTLKHTPKETPLLF